MTASHAGQGEFDISYAHNRFLPASPSAGGIACPGPPVRQPKLFSDGHLVQRRLRLNGQRITGKMGYAQQDGLLYIFFQ